VHGVVIFLIETLLLLVKIARVLAVKHMLRIGYLQQK